MQPIFHPEDKMYLDLLEILYEQLLSKDDYRGTLEANLQILQHYHRYGNNGYGVSSPSIFAEKSTPPFFVVVPIIKRWSEAESFPYLKIMFTVVKKILCLHKIL